MYENKNLFLLSACLLLPAHVSDGNASIDGQNLPDRPAPTQTATANTPQTFPSETKLITREKSASSGETFERKHLLLKSSLPKTDEDGAFHDNDRLEEQTDAVTAMLQQQLFAPHDGNLILQVTKRLPEEGQAASAEMIAAALRVRLGEALKKICLYDTHILDTLAMQLAEVVYRHGIRRKRPFVSFNSEDIQFMTAGLYHVLQDTDIQRLIVF